MRMLWRFGEEKEVPKEQRKNAEKDAKIGRTEATEREDVITSARKERKKWNENVKEKNKNKRESDFVL